MPLRNMKWLTRILSAMMIIIALAQPAKLILDAIVPSVFAGMLIPDLLSYDEMWSLTVSVFALLTTFVFGFWLYLAGVNLVRAQVSGLQFSAASRIWWFFVPIMFLYRPFQGMRELWNASHGTHPYDTGNSLVALWWATYLASYLVSALLYLNWPEEPDSFALWIDAVGYLISSVVALRLVNAIAAAQRQLGTADLAEVFA